MLIFLDTEFTGLGQGEPKLISIALVPADGGPEFYAELAEGEGWTRLDCADFVLDEVLPLLRGGSYRITRAELKQKLQAWFKSRQNPDQLACDSETDFRFLKQLLADCWPVNLAKAYFDLRVMAENAAFNHAVTRYYATNPPEHNALNDAHACRSGWLAWTNDINTTDNP